MKRAPSMKRALVAAFAIVIVTASACPAAWDYRDEILYTDLVVRGVVEGIDGERVPVQDYMPSDPREGATIPISVVRFRVEEVLKGTLDEAMLTFVVPGGEPGSPVGLTDLSYDLAAGDEAVISLIFWKTMRGGSYMLRTDLGRWDASHGRWVNRQHNEVSVPLNEIQAAVEPGIPERMFENADLVVAGKIDGIRREERDGAGVEVVSVKVSESWKGRAGDVVDVSVIRGGGFDLDWWRSVPAMNNGEEWLLFLKRHEGGYFAFAGSNGALRIENGRLLRNNAVDYGLSKEVLKQRLTKGERYERED